jgi:PAS domain S-box-containing protein
MIPTSPTTSTEWSRWAATPEVERKVVGAAYTFDLVSDTAGRLIEQMLEASPDAILVVGAGGIIESAPAAVEILFGYRPDELVGQPVEVLVPDALGHRHQAHREAYWEHPKVRNMGVGLDLRAKRRDGSDFPVDVSLVPIFVGDTVRIGAFVRDSTERRRGEDLQRFLNEISRSALAGGDTPELLSLASERARELIGASISWIAVRSHHDDQIVVAAADGIHSDSLLGATVPAEGSLAGKAMVESRTISIGDMATEPAVIPEARKASLGPGLYLPMLAEDGPVGTLVLARTAGATPFSPAEVSIAEVFASAAAIVLALGTARQSLEAVRLTAEHERIARDLHDTVIQRLFGLGMRLQAAERLASGPVSDRIRETVDSIDDVIREIRETIFDLNRPDTEGPALRQRFRKVAAEVSEPMGLSPRIAFRGPVEAAVSDELAVHLLSVLREGLTNVGRHARATGVDVVLGVAEGDIVLSIADDGVGMSNEPTAGHGTANMASRAEELGGQLTLTPRKPSGTLLQWRVPRNR